MIVIRIYGLPNLENPDSLFREVMDIASVLKLPFKHGSGRPVIYFMETQLGWHLNKIVHVETIGPAGKENIYEYAVAKSRAYIQFEAGIRQAIQRQFEDIEVFFTHFDSRLQELR